MNFDEMFTETELKIYKKIYISLGVDWVWSHNPDPYAKVSESDQYVLSEDRYKSPRNGAKFISYIDYISPIATNDTEKFTFSKEFIDWIGEN